jgi:hypothetical protein
MTSKLGWVNKAEKVKGCSRAALVRPTQASAFNDSLTGFLIIGEAVCNMETFLALTMSRLTSQSYSLAKWEHPARTIVA